MKSEKELFNLARRCVVLFDYYVKAVIDYDELERQINKIKNTILENGYDNDKFIEYRELCKNMTIEECREFIKTLN